MSNPQYPQYPAQAAAPTSLEAFGDPSALLALAGGDSTRSVGGGDAPPRVSIRGRVFRLVVNGTEVLTNPHAMDFVIVAAAPAVARTYYQGAYTEGSHEQPSCQSQDGIVPMRNSTAPQSTNCAQCPQNVAGSGNQGQGRACRYSQTIAVCLPGDWDNVYSMRVPAKSLFGANPQTNQFGLQGYAKYVSAKRFTLGMLVTRFDWNYNENVALLFSAVRPLTPDEYRQVLAMQTRPDVLRAISAPEGDDWFAGAPVPTVPVQVQAPVYQQPVAPVYQQPVAPAPVYQQPVAPVYQQPVAPAPVYQQPVAPAPVYQQPVAPAPVYQQPVAPVYQQPVAPAPVAEAVATRPPKAKGKAQEPLETAEIPTPVIRSNAPQAPVGSPTLEQLAEQWANDE
jgi:hypothetical protein